MNRKLKLWELERPSLEEYKDTKRFPIILVLDNIRSLNNVGTFFRTGDAFNIEQIILCGITPCPPHREIQKTALGATESVQWTYCSDILEVIKELRKQGVKICSIEQVECPTLLQNMEVASDTTYAVVMGNEVDGVQQKVIDASDFIIEIPQFGTKHSLNVSVCAGIVLWEFVKVQLLRINKSI
jgi:23S rRNA (guanosine2251-2'-O)-methyltransferase